MPTPKKTVKIIKKKPKAHAVPAKTPKSEGVEKKTSPATVTSTGADAAPQVVFSVGKGGKGKAVPAVLLLKHIHVLKDFNPRNELGDVADLKESIQQVGLGVPLTVRPLKDGAAGHVSLVDGHRRYAVLKALGVESVPVLIRMDLTDDADALAMALAVGSGDGQKPLNPVELGRALKRYMDATGAKSAAEVAKKTGHNYQAVRRYLLLADGPEDIQEKVAKGEMAFHSALEFLSLDEGVQKKIASQVEADMSKGEIRELARASARAEGARPSATNQPLGKQGKDDSPNERVASMVAWKGSREVQAMIGRLSHCYLNLQADDDPMFYAGALSVLLWQRGTSDEIGDFNVFYQMKGSVRILPETLDDKHTKEEREIYKVLLSAMRAAAEKHAESEGDSLVPAIPDAADESAF